MEGEAGTFFESGNPVPTAEGKAFLIALAEELGKLPNKVSIEGHTDAKPFAKVGNYGNWELSADRANAARRLMQDNGMAPGQVVQIRGYADQQLRKKDSPEDPSNRRITVIVQYTPKGDAGADAENGSEPPKDAEAPKGGEAAKSAEH
jgi:chemotaxis protein MotB